MPKVSIIVPVYKAEAYLHACVASILSQTFSDFELFLVNDGSPDNCGAMCDGFAAQDSRIRVIHQENQGQAAARNHAFAQSVGEWICFVDSDDLIHPSMVQMLYDAAVENNAGISMCQMLEAVELPSDFFAEREKSAESLTMDEETLTALYDREEYPAWVACAKLIRRDLVAGYPFYEGRVYEDNEAVCHWVCSAGTLVRIPLAMYFYRTNPGSTTQSTFSLKRLDYLWALERIIRYYSSLGYEKMKDRFASRYADALASCCYGVRYDLGRPELVKGLEKTARNLIRQEKLRFSREQWEQFLDAAHPKLIRLYWPVAGALRTLRETGAAGLLEKIKKQLRKGDGQ